MPADFSHVSDGFRVDPMVFVRNDGTAQGALVGTLVFADPADGDQALIDAEAAKLLEGQREDGTVGDTTKDTGAAIVELHKLGYPMDSEAAQRGVVALLRQKRAGQNADEWYEVDGALNIYPLHALLLTGYAYEPEVAFSLRWLPKHPESWIGPHAGCPWTPQVFINALWEARGDPAVDRSIEKALRWILEDTNEAGQVTYKDPWGLIDSAGYVDHSFGREIIVKMLPLILRGQRPDGGWGPWSPSVFRALVKYGLLDPLRELPPLPPD